MDKQDLVSVFSKAREDNSPFVFVGIDAEGVREVIVIPKYSFDAKEKFYLNAYNDELVHVMNSKVSICSLSYGEAEELYLAL